MKQLLRHTIRLLAVLLLPLAIVSCGGGGGVNEASFSPATRADLIISLQSQNGGLNVGDILTGVDIRVHLPNGAAFISAVGVSNGGVTGNFDAITNSVHLAVTGPTGISVGPIAKVRCSMTTPLTSNAFTNANGGTPLTDFIPTALDAIGNTIDPVILRTKLLPTLVPFLY